MNFENVPEQLKKLPQWVARVDKIPVSPHTMSGAKANDPKTWGSFAQAVKCIGHKSSLGKINGVGIELQAPLCGIDIDHCRDSKTGELTAEAQEIVDLMESYTEISPSGTGVHILYLNSGDTYPGRRKKKAIDSVQHIEMYQSQRYFTITGDTIKGFDTLNKRPDQADKLYRQYLAKTPQLKNKKTVVSSDYSADLSDNEIIKRAATAQNGSLFSALWSGDTSGYNGDNSRADLALCNLLAFWTGADGAAIDRLFRQSALMRPKWDERRGGVTYGQLTIQQALEQCTEIYAPKSTSAQRRSKKKKPARKKSMLPDFTLEDICKYEPDDIGTANCFADLVRGFMRYVSEEKTFFIFNGVFWERDVVKENLAANKILMDFVANVQTLIPPPDRQAQADEYKVFRAQYKALGKSSGRERVMKDIKSLLRASRGDFDTQPHLLNCENCTVNLKTGKAQDHNAADLISKCTNTEYLPQARNDRFEQFIDEICEGNTEQKKALQIALGYSLIGSAPEDCFFIALGKKTRNGKSVLFNLVKDTLGDYAAEMDFNTIARSKTKDASRATPDLARLAGVRFVLVQEPSKGACFNEALIKQLTGNDVITARPMYGNVFEFIPCFALYISSNNLPTITDDTLFTSERIKILPFNRHFSKSERDTSLRSTLRKGDGRAAVLNWLIEGYAHYKKIGLSDTEQSKIILDEYQAENDYVQMFIAERLDVGKSFGRERFSEVLGEYREWCKRAGTTPLGRKLFKIELEKHNVNIAKSHNQDFVEGKLKRYY